jgi:hypothetical protein
MSVALQLKATFLVQEPHVVDTYCSVQLGSVPPFTTTVEQQ